MINKKIIINADDFGLNEICTRAICEALQRGFVTDATVVANGKAYSNAVESIQKYHLENRIGIHFNLTECEPLSNKIKECKSFVKDGRFHRKVNRLKPLSRLEKQALYEELNAQVKRLEDDGICITHADSHNHIHTAVFVLPIVLRVCREHGIKKIRLHRNIGHIVFYKRIIKKAINMWITHEGFITTHFFGDMQDVVGNEKSGNLEIMVHPDYDKHGNLVDRKLYVENVAVGEKLYLLTDLEKNIVFSSYNEV